MASPITQEEWLAELERIQKQAPEADGFLTMQELRDRMHKGPDSIRDMLRRAHNLGILETRRKQIGRIDGGVQMVPAYRVKAPKKR